MVALAGAADAGTINGRVTFPQVERETPPPLTPYARSRYSAAPEPPSIPGGQVVAVVHLEDAPNLRIEIPQNAPRPVVDQQNLTIIPQVLPIQAGTTVEFRNSDNVHHNIFSLSPPKKFDLGRYGKGKSKLLVFDQPGEVRIYCDIHPDMNSVVLVTPNRFFSGIRPDGVYSLDGIPAGNYQLTVWHLSLGKKTMAVTLAEDDTISVDFNLMMR